MCSPHRTIDVQTWRIFFSFFPSPNSNRFVDSARTGMRIKSGSNVSDPDVWFHAFEDYSHRSSPSREQNSTRATDPRESNSGLENDIYYNRGAVFIVPKDYHILETNSIHIAVLLEKKKKNTFLLKLYRFPLFDSFLSSSARLDGHGGVARAPLSRLNRLEKMGHRETRSPCGRETA